ncbi:MAG: MerR family transcriptional regulator [Acidobacteriota bacterium]
MPSPKREMFRSPDVCEMAEIQPFVLRSWEAEFPGLGEPVGGGNGRLYRRTDVELVFKIKQLVFGEGLTLAGARRRLEEAEAGPSMAAVAVDDALGGLARTRLRRLRTGLEGILALLSRRPEYGVSDLQLVTPRAAERGARRGTRAAGARHDVKGKRPVSKPRRAS